jgi:hypothetical protein
MTMSLTQVLVPVDNSVSARITLGGDSKLNQTLGARDVLDGLTLLVRTQGEKDSVSSSMWANMADRLGERIAAVPPAFGGGLKVEMAWRFKTFMQCGEAGGGP